MIALGLISLLGAWGSMSLEGDSLQRQDPFVEKPTDTVHIRAQRIDFATIGRVVRPLVSGDNDQLLTAVMQDAGVFFKQYGVTGSSTISRRGADANQTQINWNGLPVNNPMLGMSDFNTLMSWGCGEMFLVEGGNSAVVGSGSMGGTLFMRNGLQFLDGSVSERNTVHSRAMSTLGSFGERNLAAQVKWVGKRRFASFDVADFSHKNAFVFNDLGLDMPQRRMENALKTQQMMRVVSGMKWNRSQFRAVMEFAGMSRQLGLAMGSLKPLGKQLDVNLRGVLEHQVSFKGHISMLQRLGGVVDQIDYYSAPDDSVGSLSRGKTLHYQNEIYYSYKTVRVLLGTDVQYQRANTEYYLGWAKRVLPASLMGVYWVNKKWSAVGNARYEWNERVPTAGVSLQFQASRRLAWKSNLHTSFRRPTLNDLFWVSGAALSPLKSEKGWGSELGLLWQPQTIILRSAKISANAELTTYYRELDFPILWVPAGAVWRATNISGGGRYSGLQLSAQIQAQIQQSKFGIQTNFDRVKALVKQSSQGPEYQQIFVPLYNGNLAVSLHRPNNQFVLNTQFTGYRYVQTDNLDGLPAYALLNAAWRHKNLLQLKGISADLGIQLQNITQTVYYSMPGRPMPGRSMQFTLWVQTISKSHINKIK